MGNISEIYGGQGFNTDRDDAATGFAPMPPGWYPAEIEKAELKTNKNQTGRYLQLEMTVVGEKYANRKLWAMITLVNPNEKAVEIGQRELAALGQAAGLPVITDSDELLGKTVQVKIKVDQDEGYEPKNVVTGYKPVGEVSNTPRQTPTKSNIPAPPTQQQAPPAQAPASTAGKKLPWQR